MYFTYLLGWSNSNKYYYGVRYKEGADVTSIGTTYFSSSKYVRNYIKLHGTPDIIQIRKIFDTKIDAKRWEEKVIRRLNCVKSEKWLNRGNNNSFKDIVMCEEIAQSISTSKKIKNKNKPPVKYYNNGQYNKRFREGDVIPDGWILGKIISEKQKEWINHLNNNILTDEKRQEIARKISITTKGKPKPEGFGQKISEAQQGKSKPWNSGDNNPAKREDVRRKISESKKGCKHYTNGIKLIFVKSENAPEGFWQTSISQFKELYENK